MHKNQAKDLFQLQSELVDTKVNMAVGNAIDRVIEQIHDLRSEMHKEMNGIRNEMHRELNSIRHDMNQGFAAHDQRLVAIETKLGMLNETRKEIRARFFEYGFKGGWIMLGVIITYFITHVMRPL